jgi:hypothetical protein
LLLRPTIGFFARPFTRQSRGATAGDFGAQAQAPAALIVQNNIFSLAMDQLFGSCFAARVASTIEKQAFREKSAVMGAKDAFVL